MHTSFEPVEYDISAETKRMYLDSLSTSVKAISLYRKAGFVDTEKYNSSRFSDVFMVMEL